jgi:hypothetical protein
MSTMALELEAVPEYEDELELEWEGDPESEEFFRRLAGLAGRAMRSPTLRRAAAAAARSVLGGAGMPGLGGPGGLAGPAAARPGARAGARAGAAGGAALGRVMADLVPGVPGRGGQRELEWEWELEGEVNPIRRVYPDALMEHLGHRAAETPNRAEAEALMGALAPLAARLVPQAAGAIRRSAPQLARGLAGITQALRADPATRPLIRTVPRIMRATAASLARQAAGGQPVTGQRAVGTLADQAARTLASPQRSLAAWQQSRVLDRAYHRQVRPTAGPGL